MISVRRENDPNVAGSDLPRAAVEIAEISKTYSTADGPILALDRVSIDVNRGEFLSIVGPSGCGKSTLMLIAAGLVPPSLGTVRIEGAIDNSLYEAINAQVPDSQLESEDRVRLAWDLADIYAWQVDFTRDIQTGDRFRVLYERLVSADGEVRFGRILAGDLTMSGKSLTAFRFDAGGHAAFYDAQGNSLRRAFLHDHVLADFMRGGGGAGLADRVGTDDRRVLLFLLRDRLDVGHVGVLHLARGDRAVGGHVAVLALCGRVRGQRGLGAVMAAETVEGGNSNAADEKRG